MAIECRESDDSTIELLSHLDHLDTRLVCTAEREFMNTLEGGCSVPIGVDSQLSTKNGRKILSMIGIVVSVDGTQYAKSSIEEPVDNIISAKSIGKKLAKLILDNGAKPILAQLLRK